MIFDDDVHVHFGRELAEPAQAIDGGGPHVIGGPLARSVYPDRMTAEKLRRLNPLIVILDGLGPLGIVRIAEQLMLDRGYVIPLHWEPWNTVVSKRLVNGVMNPTNNLDVINSYLAKS